MLAREQLRDVGTGAAGRKHGELLNVSADEEFGKRALGLGEIIR